MKAFEFPLARVLAWRRAQATAELSRLEQLQHREQTLAAQRDRLLTGARDEAAEAARPGARPAPWELTTGETYGRYARTEAARLNGEIEAMRRAIGTQRERVRAAEQACQLLEKLHDRKLAAWKEGAAKELDELASEAFLSRWSNRRA